MEAFLTTMGLDCILNQLEQEAFLKMTERILKTVMERKYLHILLRVKSSPPPHTHTHTDTLHTLSFRLWFSLLAASPHPQGGPPATQLPKGILLW